MKKWIHILFVMATLLCLSLPLLFMNHQKDVVSDIDNRTLQSAPEWFEKDFQKKTEAYIQDRVGFRNEMLNAYHSFSAAVLGDLAHPLYDYGRDGYIFSTLRHSLQYGDYHENFAQAVLRIQQYCEENGIRFYLMFDPQKETIYSQYLPRGVNRKVAWVKALLNRFDQLGIRYVDFTKLLKEKSETEQVYNQQYDAAHWNDLGHFYAAQELISQIKQDFPAMKALDQTQFTFTTQTAHTLKQSEFVIDEQTPLLKPVTKVEDLTKQYRNELAIDSQFPTFFYYHNPLPEAKAYPRLLSFQGSYWNRGRQFLQASFQDYIGIHNYHNIFNIEYYVNLFQPDVVVLDVAEYVLSDTYFPTNSLLNQQYSPAIVNRSLPIDEQVAALLTKSKQLYAEQILDRAEGSGIDRLFLTKNVLEAQYMYAILGNTVYTLNKDTESGLWTVSIDHLAELAGSGWLYCITAEGERYHAPLSIAAKEAVTWEKKELSTGVTENDKTYTLTTTVDGNRFNLLRLSLLAADSNRQRQVLGEYREPGTYHEYYYHALPSGRYRLQVKANSNLSDETIIVELELEQGKQYRFSATLDTLEDQQMDVSDVEILSLQ